MICNFWLINVKRQFQFINCSNETRVKRCKKISSANTAFLERLIINRLECHNIAVINKEKTCKQLKVDPQGQSNSGRSKVQL